jgi:hypothetical protein
MAFWRILLLSSLFVPKGAEPLSPDPEMNRRSALQQSLGSVVSSSAIAGLSSGMSIIDPVAHAASFHAPKESSLLAYQVFPDATPALNPRIKSVTVRRLVVHASGARLTWVHENTPKTENETIEL